MQILNSPVMLTRLLACSFCWLTNTFVYYGLSLNSVAFAGDKYLNFILVAVVEIPAYFLTWFLTDYVGRKATLSSSFLLSGAFCLAIQFVPTGNLDFPGIPWIFPEFPRRISGASFTLHREIFEDLELIRRNVKYRYITNPFQVPLASCRWFCTWEGNGASRCPSPRFTFTRRSCSPPT